jgi:ankyrin repeat protein
MSLLDLPREILFMIAEELEEKEILQLVCTSQYLHGLLLSEILYKRNIQSSASALLWCAEKGVESTARQLLLLNANVNVRSSFYSQTPLILAVRNRHYPIVELLLDYKADVNLFETSNATALHSAAENGDEKIVHILLHHGADINSTNHFAQTPLCLAAYEGHCGVINILLDRGAIMGFPNLDKDHLAYECWFSPLHAAVEESEEGNKSTAALKLLISRGAEVDMLDGGGETALHWAASFGANAMIQALLEHGADVNRPNLDGKTALHIAAEHTEQVDTIRILLDRGADWRLTTMNGLTPLQVAKEFGHEDNVRLFEKHIASHDSLSADESEKNDIS